MVEEKRKSRSIPLMEYYEILQFEFLSYYFRYLTYKREVDKKKYSEFCKKKKITIDNFARRNCFPSIFNDASYFSKKLDLFFYTGETGGMPNYTYRDDHQTLHLGFWDKVYYFKLGTQVTYLKSNEQWTIKLNLCKFDEDYDFVVLEKEGKPSIKVHYSEIRRDWDTKEFNFDEF